MLNSKRELELKLSLVIEDFIIFKLKLNSKMFIENQSFFHLQQFTLQKPQLGMTNNSSFHGNYTQVGLLQNNSNLNLAYAALTFFTVLSCFIAIFGMCRSVMRINEPFFVFAQVFGTICGI